jgi:hypothetical protein
MAASVPNQSSRWINLSPFESDEFGIPRAYVQFTTSAAEEILAGTMEACMVALAQALANGNAANLQMSNPERDPLGDLPRGRHALDGDRFGHIRHGHERPLPSRRKRLLRGSGPFRHRRRHWTNLSPSNYRSENSHRSCNWFISRRRCRQCFHTVCLIYAIHLSRTDSTRRTRAAAVAM